MSSPLQTRRPRRLSTSPSGWRGGRPSTRRRPRLADRLGFDGPSFVGKALDVIRSRDAATGPGSWHRRSSPILRPCCRGAAVAWGWLSSSPTLPKGDDLPPGRAVSEWLPAHPDPGPDAQADGFSRGGQAPASTRTTPSPTRPPVPSGSAETGAFSAILSVSDGFVLRRFTVPARGSCAGRSPGVHSAPGVGG